TNSERIDLHAEGSIYISEAGGVELGRSGLNGGGDGIDENIELTLGSGIFSSITGLYEFDGVGTFILNSSGVLELATLVRATDGNVAIDVDSLRDGTIDEGLLLEVRNGRLSIVATNGIGGAATDDIEIAVGELTATTVTDDVQLELSGDTSIVAEGVEVAGGSGTLSLSSPSGSLGVDASITHGGSGTATLDFANGNITVNSLIEQSGSGDLLLRADNGMVLMTNVGRINTNSGLLDLRASDNVELSRITSTTGNIFVKSELESVRRLSGFLVSNIVASNRPVIEVAKIAQFTVQSSAVTINGFTFFRAFGNSFISVTLIYSI
ncbi:MAG: hypothetical protein ACI9ZV_000442, partial [Candidatus Azotimanducaceae bacterium]